MKKKISIRGSYNNISLNRILQKLDIADWKRVRIKLSSSDFFMESNIRNQKKIIENLHGEMLINGSVLFISTEEERFGAAFLSLIADRLSDLLSLSKSINYILNKFADTPSNISGKLFINQGILRTEKLIINNKKEKALLSLNLNLKKNIIDGKIDLYENNIIFLSVQLKGSANNPKILVNGHNFIKEENNKTQDIKKIFEKGIKSLVDSIIELND